MKREILLPISIAVLAPGGLRHSRLGPGRQDDRLRERFTGRTTATPRILGIARAGATHQMRNASAGLCKGRWTRRGTTTCRGLPRVIIELRTYVRSYDG